LDLKSCNFSYRLAEVLRKSEESTLWAGAVSRPVRFLTGDFVGNPGRLTLPAHGVGSQIGVGCSKFNYRWTGNKCPTEYLVSKIEL
jgi:hypothetical protein